MACEFLRSVQVQELARKRRLDLSNFVCPYDSGCAGVSGVDCRLTGEKVPENLTPAAIGFDGRVIRLKHKGRRRGVSKTG